jgi:hypothetical protein
MLAALCAHRSGLRVAKIAVFGRAGEEWDGHGGGRSQQGDEQCPFHGKTSVKMVSDPKPPSTATSWERASSIGYAVLDGTIPTVFRSIARSRAADRSPEITLDGDQR